jgi:molybdopterin-guanine dinucleotide biosynthesis protein B
MSPPLFGVVGWKNSGKTTLMANLVRELSRRGFAVSVIKHAHERFDIDHPGRDSFKLRVALMRELGNEPELPFEEIRACLGPSDLVLIEGFKREAFPKIEIRRDGAASREPLRGNFPEIVSIASDRPETEEDSLPTFHLDDTDGIADFIIEHLGLARP